MLKEREQKLGDQTCLLLHRHAPPLEVGKGETTLNVMLILLLTWTYVYFIEKLSRFWPQFSKALNHMLNLTSVGLIALLYWGLCAFFGSKLGLLSKEQEVISEQKYAHSKQKIVVFSRFENYLHVSWKSKILREWKITWNFRHFCGKFCWEVFHPFSAALFIYFAKSSSVWTVFRLVDFPSSTGRCT